MQTELEHEMVAAFGREVAIHSVSLALHRRALLDHRTLKVLANPVALIGHLVEVSPTW